MKNCGSSGLQAASEEASREINSLFFSLKSLRVFRTAHSLGQPGHNRKIKNRTLHKRDSIDWEHDVTDVTNGNAGAEAKRQGEGFRIKARC